MSRPELSETLVALVSAVSVSGEAERVIPVEVDLRVPMEISLDGRDGALVVRAAPGHTRFVSGFLPPVHTTRLRIVTGGDEPYGGPSDETLVVVPPGWAS